MPIISAPRLPITLACLLLLACGPGTSTTDDSSTTATASASATAGTTGTTSDTPTSTTDTTTAPTTTEGSTSDPPDTTTAGTTTAMTTTDVTTEDVDCPFAGERECAVLVIVSDELTMEDCTACQGAACGSNPNCDSQYPCVDDKIVLQGCCGDEDCAGLTPFCGMFIATNNICVTSDDV